MRLSRLHMVTVSATTLMLSTPKFSSACLFYPDKGYSVSFLVPHLSLLDSSVEHECTHCIHGFQRLTHQKTSIPPDWPDPDCRVIISVILICYPRYSGTYSTYLQPLPSKRPSIFTPPLSSTPLKLKSHLIICLCVLDIGLLIVSFVSNKKTYS